MSTSGQTPYVIGEARSARARRRARRWVGLAAAAVGLPWAAVAALDVLRAREAAGWPVAPGRVVSAQVREEIVGARVGKWQNSPDVRSRLHVAYEYAAGGRRLRGTRIDGVLRPDERDLAADRARYPVGRAVEVHYAPDDPSRAVLETTVPPRRVAELLIGLGLAAAGLLWGRQPSRRTRRPRAGARAA